MHSRILIDAIVRQTTVLIAQLSTTAGIRAPLARLADQVFVELASAIESQGVPRKVAADMFGMALRSYQKKVNRLAESLTDESSTLWEGILDFLAEHGTATRREIVERFVRDDPQTIGAVLNDLVTSGLAHRSGTADSALYGLTSESDLKKLIDESNGDTASSMAWLRIYRSGGISVQDLASELDLSIEQMEEMLAGLADQGRIQIDGAGAKRTVRAGQFVVPVGSSVGWEAAVFDHFQAMATAIAQKLQKGSRRSGQDDVVGGTTLSFNVYPGHPHFERVLSLLRKTRRETDDLWNEVAEYNRVHEPPEATTKVTFYAGQAVQEGDE